MKALSVVLLLLCTACATVAPHGKNTINYHGRADVKDGFNKDRVAYPSVSDEGLGGGDGGSN